MLEGTLLRWDFFFCMARKQMGGLCLAEMVKSEEIWSGPLFMFYVASFFMFYIISKVLD